MTFSQSWETNCFTIGCQNQNRSLRKNVQKLISDQYFDVHVITLNESHEGKNHFDVSVLPSTGIAEDCYFILAIGLNFQMFYQTWRHFLWTSSRYCFILYVENPSLWPSHERQTYSYTNSFCSMLLRPLRLEKAMFFVDLYCWYTVFHFLW